MPLCTHHDGSGSLGRPGTPLGVIGWVLAFIAISAPTAYAVAQEVRVSNTTADPVNARVVGTVVTSEQPFQQLVVPQDSSGNEACDALKVPAGKTLTVQQVAGQAGSSTFTAPQVFLRHVRSGIGNVSLVRGPYLKMSSIGNTSWAAETSTGTVVGVADPTFGSWTQTAVCVRRAAGASFGDFRGVVAGTLK